MISVERSGTNYFILKGDCLLGGVSESRITVLENGYGISLKVKKKPRQEANKLKSEEVIPTLKTMLAELLGEEREEINEAEFTRYLDAISRFAAEYLLEKEEPDKLSPNTTQDGRTKTMPVIDLKDDREARNKTLLDAIEKKAERQQLTPRRVAELILGDTIGNTLIDDEMEESLLIALAGTFGCTTKNPQHDLNGGFEGNGED